MQAIGTTELPVGGGTLTVSRFETLAAYKCIGHPEESIA